MLAVSATYLGMLHATQLEQTILMPLQASEALRTKLVTRITDADDRLVAVATIIWQIKCWDKVRTRVS